MGGVAEAPAFPQMLVDFQISLDWQRVEMGLFKKD